MYLAARQCFLSTYLLQVREGPLGPPQGVSDLGGFHVAVGLGDLDTTSLRDLGLEPPTLGSLGEVLAGELGVRLGITTGGEELLGERLEGLGVRRRSGRPRGIEEDAGAGRHARAAVVPTHGRELQLLDGDAVVTEGLVAGDLGAGDLVRLQLVLVAAVDVVTEHGAVGPLTGLDAHAVLEVVVLGGLVEDALDGLVAFLGLDRDDTGDDDQMGNLGHDSLSLLGSS